MRWKFLILAVCASAIWVGGASAHHSFAATYIVDKEIKVDGKLVEFMYRNPHSFVKVEAPDDAGQMQTWTVEWGGGAQLSRDGVSRDTLKAGDRVIVSGNPGRDASEHRLRLHSIVRPADGWKWVGTIQ
jgi:multidrug efflux pump subunit AcrA (membrane-fusion protein)